jgi:hypothetical protein
VLRGQHTLDRLVTDFAAERSRVEADSARLTEILADPALEENQREEVTVELCGLVFCRMLLYVSLV